MAPKNNSGFYIMNQMNKLLPVCIMLMAIAGCSSDCFDDYLKYYRKNEDVFLQTTQYDEAVFSLRYLPFGTLAEALQSDSMDTYYFTVEMSGSPAAHQSILSRAVFASDSIFYLRNARTDQLIYASLVQPEVTGLENRLRYLLGFSKETLENDAYFFILEDIHFTNTQYAFPVSIHKILSLENRYCFKYDQK